MEEDDTRLHEARLRLLQPIARYLGGDTSTRDDQPVGIANIDGRVVEFWDTNIWVEMDESGISVGDTFDASFSFEVFVMIRHDLHLPQSLLDRELGLVEDPDLPVLVEGLERMIQVPEVKSVSTSSDGDTSEVLVTMQISANAEIAGRAISKVVKLASGLGS